MCVGIFYVRWWCAFLFDCLVGFMPARHIYMRPAQIIIHSTGDTNQPLRLVQMKHTHINYLDALNCTGSASVHIYHHTAYTSIWLINFLCSWCSIDKIIFYFERKLSMVIFLYEIKLFMSIHGWASITNINGKMRFGKVVQVIYSTLLTHYTIHLHLKRNFNSRSYFLVLIRCLR